MEKHEMFRMAIQNGRVNLAKGMEHTYVSINYVVNLVYSSQIPQRHLGLKIPAKELLVNMASSVWDIVAGPHETDEASKKKILIKRNILRYGLQIDHLIT